MDCRDENDRINHNHGHSHGGGGHDHGDHDHVPPPDTFQSQSLHNRIYHDHIRTLNETEQDSGKDVFKSWENRLDTTKVSIPTKILFFFSSFVDLSCNVQLTLEIIFIPFIIDS